MTETKRDPRTFRQLIEHPLVRGLCVGCCVSGLSFEDYHRARKDELVEAHAHYHAGDPWHGFICVRSPKDLPRDRNAALNPTLLHEFAHLKSEQPAGARFERVMHELGQHRAAAAAHRRKR